jgi:Carboxypeptidase regulatory-like domain/TonB dependent receptor-like, beta-barrel
MSMNQTKLTKQRAFLHNATLLAIRLLSAVAVAAAILVSIGTAVAQRTTGTLRGQVLDPAGAAVPSVRVTAINQDTRVSISIETTSAGTYDFPSVLPGKYTVTVEAAGFKKFVKSDVPVLADQDNVADAKLELGTASQTVEVVAGAAQVQTTDSSLNNDFDANDVGNLPNAAGTLNGSPLNLAVLAPNVVAQPGGVTGIGGSVGGTRPRDNNFVVDGVDDNNLGVTGNNSTVIPDAVGEFALKTNQFSAEYGHSAGGQFVLVTKTGTNTWHGSGEWYAQNKNFNSIDQLTKNAIASGTIPGQPDYDNNRFGGTVGGPLIRDKFFVFGAYEYTTLHGAGTPTALLAPTADGLATLRSMAADSAITNILANFPVAPAANSTPITVDGQLIPIGNLTVISPVLQREHDVQFNTDYTWGKHQFGTRFLLNQERFIAPVNSTQAVFNQNNPVHNRKIALTDAYTISSHWLNDLRLQYSFYFAGFLNPCSTCPNDVTIGDLGFNTIGPGDNSDQKQNTYEIVDNVSWSHGKHTIKFGGQWTHYIYPQFFLSRSNGDYWYNTTQVLINDQTPDVSSRTLRGAGTGSFLGTQTMWAGFVQDDFKFNPRLTLNFGLRYEYWTNPVGGETQALNAISSVPGVITFGKPKTDTNNVGPRIGFAYDPTGQGKTAIRGGFGISYDVKFQNFASITLPPQLQSELNETSACTLTPTPTWCSAAQGGSIGATPGRTFLAGGGLPSVYIAPATQTAARALTTSYIDDTVLPKILTWTLGVQQQVYHNATIEVRYLGTRGLELPVQFRRNRESAFDAGIAPLPTFLQASAVPPTWDATTPTDTPFNNFNSNIYAPFGFRGNVTSDPPFGKSIYHAGSVSFVQRSRSGLTFNANYTYSDTEDNSTNEFFTSLLNPRRAQDTTRLRDDFSKSDLYVRQKFALSWTYEVPKTKLESRFAKAVLNGYQLGSVYLAQTGQPITLQSGIDSNGNGDSAGDRVVLNPSGSGLTGSDVFAVCELPGGATGLSNGGPGAFTTPTGVAAGGGCFDPSDPTGSTTFPAIGYTPVNPKAKYLVAGFGARANLGRNSFLSPGFNVLSMSVGKKTSFAEGKYLLVRADFFNVLNHPNFALSNGNVFSTAGVTTATTTQGYALPTDPNFLKPDRFFSGGIRSITLVLKLVF